MTLLLSLNKEAENPCGPGYSQLRRSSEGVSSATIQKKGSVRLQIWVKGVEEQDMAVINENRPIGLRDN